MLRKSRKLLLMLISIVLTFSLFACAVEEAGSDTDDGDDNGITSNDPLNDDNDGGSAVNNDVIYSSPIDTDSLYDMSATEFSRLIGHGVNLGNTMEACDSSNRIPNQDPGVYEAMWQGAGYVTTQEMITGLRETGFTALRIPVAWTNAMDFDNDDYTIGQTYLDRVEEIVNYALNEDMFVFINNHWDHGWWSMFGHPEPDVREKAMKIYTEIWTQVSAHFKDYDLRVIFEAGNEEIGDRLNDVSQWSPTGGTLTNEEQYEMVTVIQQQFIDVVRTTGGNNADRFLLVKGFHTDIPRTAGVDLFVMPEDPADKLILGVHYYTPWTYCGDNAGVPNWGALTDIEEMNDLLQRMTEFTKQGYGILIGEWGVLDNEGEDRLTYYNNFLNNADLYGYATTLWDTGKAYDRANAEWRAPEIKELFQTRKEMRMTMTVDELKAAAEESMAEILKIAEARPQITYEADEAFAWIMFSSGDWGTQYSVGDLYKPNEKAAGLEVVDPEVTGEGSYEVSLDFTGTASGYSGGIAFSALAVMNGEILFPGYFMEITEVLINGEPVEIGKYYTTHDNPTTTRINLYNAWVSSIPKEARRADGDLEDVTPIPMEEYSSTTVHIETLVVRFDYIAP